MRKLEQSVVNELKKLRDTKVRKYAGGIEDYLLCDYSKKIIDDAISLIENLDDEIDAMEGIVEFQEEQIDNISSHIDYLQEEVTDLYFREE